MNCPECNGTTKVVDRRGVRRRRSCDTCNYRFSTIEMLASDVPKKPELVQTDAALIDKPTVEPEKKANQEAFVPIAQKNASARRKIEDLQEMKRLKENFDFFEDDYDYIPEKW